VLEVATFQELAHDRADDGSPEAIPLLIALFIDRLELRIEALDQLVEGCLLRLPGLINAAGHLGPTAHGRPPWAARLRRRRSSGKPSSSRSSLTDNLIVVTDEIYDKRQDTASPACHPTSFVSPTQTNRH
jgi:hypothetical protein